MNTSLAEREGQCPCGSAVRYRAYRLACIVCGAGCCPACTFVFESAAYCSACTESILEIPLMRAGARLRTPGGGGVTPCAARPVGVMRAPRVALPVQ